MSEATEKCKTCCEETPHSVEYTKKSEPEKYRTRLVYTATCELCGSEHTEAHYQEWC